VSGLPPATPAPTEGRPSTRRSAGIARILTQPEILHLAKVTTATLGTRPANVDLRLCVIDSGNYWRGKMVAGSNSHIAIRHLFVSLAALREANCFRFRPIRHLVAADQQRRTFSRLRRRRLEVR